MVADWPIEGTDADDAFGLFILPASGEPGGVRLLGNPLNRDFDSKEGMFSPDGLRVIARGALVTATENDLYSTTDLTTPDQAPIAKRVEQAILGGDVDGFVVAP